METKHPKESASASSPTERKETATELTSTPDASAEPARLTPAWIVAGVVVLFAALLLAYSPTFRAGFIWDDDDHFAANPLVTGPDGFKAIWTSSSAIYYPLTLTTWRAVHSIFGLNPLPYHLLTLLFHGMNALLLWWILRRLAIPGAWLAAILFALHPVQVESVAWATELKNTQSALFYLFGIFCFLQFLGDAAGTTSVEPSDANSPRLPRRWVFYALSLLLFACALLSKPSTVMLPVVLLLLIAWREGRWTWSRIAATVPFFLLSALSSAWTVWEQKYHSNARGAEWSETLIERALNAGAVVWFYLGKLVWPHPLVFIYPRWTIDAKSPLWYLPGLALIAVAALLLWKRRTWGRPFLFAGAYFVALLFPVLGFFNIYFTRFSYVADHFQYLASMGFFALVGAGAAVAYRRMDDSLRLPAQGVCAALVLLLCVVTWRQTHMYRDVDTLWRTAIARNPQAWIAYNNLGLSLADRGAYADAEPCYRAALQLKPDYEEAFCNLAIACVETERYSEALKYAREAIRYRPEFAMAYDTLGTACVHLGRLDDAIANYAAAVKYNPGDAVSRFNLAAALSQKGRTKDALEQFEIAARLDPSNADIQQAVARFRARLQSR